MANETKDLLHTMSNDRLPARRDEHELEPSEHVESSREEGKGRSPEEVLGDRRERKAPAVVEGEKPDIPKKWKVRTDDGSGELVVQELTLQQIEEKGLLDKLITTAGQFPAVQRKYTDLLEKTVTGKEPAKVAAPPKKEISPVEFWNHLVTVYQPLVEESIKLNVANGWIEPDMVEAYPAGIRTFFTRIWYQQDRIEELEGKLAAAVKWIQEEEQDRTVAQVVGLLDGAIEALAKRSDGENGDQLFKDLRNPEKVVEFKEWIRTQLDPKIGSLNEENVEKFWFAFNARGILDFTKGAVKKAAEQTPSRRRAASDGTATRQGVNDTPKEKTLRERMTDLRLGPEG